MNIVYDLLSELGYVAQNPFCVVWDTKNELEVAPFVSTEYSSQVYLVVSCLNAQLDAVVNTDFVKVIAQKFRSQPFHSGDMDRNTSLLILSMHKTDESINASAKVKIEDDPYYFKKYVLSFDSLAKSKAEMWLANQKSVESIVDMIQEYIGDITRFEAYKKNYLNEVVYSYLIELVTKIPNFPMRIVNPKEIRSVDYFLSEELDKLRSKRKPVDIDANKMSGLIGLDLKTMSIEDIVSAYDDLEDGE